MRDFGPIVAGKVIVELKSVETIHAAHKKQVLTYLRLTGMKLGYVLNFGEACMKDGISRIICGTLCPPLRVSVPPCEKTSQHFRPRRYEAATVRRTGKAFEQYDVSSG